MHEALWEQVDGFKPAETARRARCEYSKQAGRLIIKLLNTEYEVDVSDRTITTVETDESADFLEQLCILAYLINAKEKPLANKVVKGEVLPGGEFYFRGPHLLPTRKLERVFGDCPESLYEIEERFGARRCGFGDASIELDVLPRVPVTMVVWGGDEEFDSRASILFDETAGEQLPLDALWTAVNLAVKAIIDAFNAGS